MKTIMLLFALTFAGCATTPCQTSATPCPATVPTCATACANGASLRCEWATPTPMGSTCEAVCENAATVGVPWNVGKLSTMTGCQ